MASASQTTYAAMLKELYPDMEVQNTALRKYPFARNVKKMDDFEGDVLVVPVEYELPLGRSATYADARANTVPTQSIKWQMSQKTDHAFVEIDALTVASTRSNRGAFVRARKREIDGMLRSLGRSLATSLYGDGWGSIGVISAVSTTTVTLTNPEDAQYFGVDMQIVAADENDGGTPRDSGNAHIVASVDEDAGTIVFDDDVAADGFAVGDFLFAEGDTDHSETTRLKIVGLKGWLPLTAPSGGDSFFGVDRSVHPTRLAGNRLDSTGNSIEENLLTITEKCVQNGGSPDICYINHINFSNLVKSLGTKVEYDGAGGTADIGFARIPVHTSAGVVMVTPDPACPPNRGYVLDSSTWTLHHLMGLPHLDVSGGSVEERKTDADGFFVHARYWAELACTAPGYNGVFSI